MTKLTQKELKKNLHLDPETGRFTRLIRSSTSINIGDEAGYVGPDGYSCLSVNSKVYLTHRLAWLYMTGEWPKDMVDHINQIRDDNKWGNLRECTNSQNQSNRPKPKDNTSGYKGVSWHKRNNRWISSIRINGKLKHLGTFTNIHEAAKAYNDRASELFGNFACLNEISEVA